MFGTFRYNETTKAHEYVKLSSNDNVDARGYARVACDSCRTRKLKCSGERDGCSRCRSTPSSGTCTYTVGMTRLSQQSIPATPGNPSKSHSPTEQWTSPGTQTSAYSNNASSTSESDSNSSPSASVAIVGPSVSSDSEFLDPLDKYLMASMSQDDYDPYVIAQRCTNSEMDMYLEAPSLDVGHPPIASTSTATHWTGIVSSAEPQIRKTKDECKCISTMTQLLEDIGTRGSGSVSESGSYTITETTGVDTLLMSLGRGTKSCSEVLKCTNCNLCANNALLMATIAQQLCQTANKVAVLVHQKGRDHEQAMEEGAIYFGRYRIASPEMRLQLLYNVVRMHLTDLQILLKNIKERIGPKRGACELLVDAIDKVVKICWMIQQLSK